ncbi:MAG: ABC transporter ATP-binding protein [Tenacibaculum sp.]|nr:ABC transporter ATP-binding protein [Tenacibaculum sp.]
MKLEIKNIGVELDNKKIIHDVSFNVRKNSFLGVLGPNGTGKSTLLKSIYGVHKPFKGEINIDGEPLLTMPRKERAKKIAVLAQETGNNFDFSVEQIVKMGRYPHKKTLENYSKEDTEIVEKTLVKMNLQDFKNRSFNKLSGGEKQRVLIARVLAQESDFIILDEPTNHLDIGHQLEIMNIIKELNITVLAAIHDMNIASLYCDDLVILNKGKVFKKGIVEEVITKENLLETFNINVDIYEKNGRRNVLYKAI